MSLNIAVIYGSVRTERQGTKLAKFITNQLKERGHEVTLVDQLEFNLPMLDKMYKEYDAGKAPEPIEKVHQVLEQADGFVLVSGEYNHGVPPVLKNILDHFQAEYHYKPSGIVTYSAGPFAGVRVLNPLRAVMGELGASSIPTSFMVSGINDAFDENGKALDEKYNKRVVNFLDELEWYAGALKQARK